MSNYENFIQDYPNRCAFILDKHYALARKQGFEVTLMLAMASSGLIVPFERLRERKHPSAEHPTQDRKGYTEATEKFDAVLKEKPFWESTLWPKKTGSWIRGKLALSTLRGYPSDPMGWSELKGATRITDDIDLECVLANVRNALAHGNVFVKSEDLQNRSQPIEQIIFLTEKRKNKVLIAYSFLACSPDDFKEFLTVWFQFLNSLKLPQGVVLESDNYYIGSEAAD